MVGETVGPGPDGVADGVGECVAGGASVAYTGPDGTRSHLFGWAWAEPGWVIEAGSSVGRTWVGDGCELTELWTDERVGRGAGENDRLGWCVAESVGAGLTWIGGAGAGGPGSMIITLTAIVTAMPIDIQPAILNSRRPLHRPFGFSDGAPFLNFFQEKEKSTSSLLSLSDIDTATPESSRKWSNQACGPGTSCS
jgi:hypothetical protein